ncbi:hypothetical protein ACFRR6_24570, partial [Streptomyces sp. NPDC056891]
MTTTDDTTTPTPIPEGETEPPQADDLITTLIPTLAAPDPKPDPRAVPRQGSGDDWWTEVYDHLDADLDTHTGTVKTSLTRRLPVPTPPGEGADREGEGGGTGNADTGDSAAPATNSESSKIPPRPLRPPMNAAPSAKNAEVEEEDNETAAEQLNSLLKRAVKEALDEHGEGEGEEEPEPAGRWERLRSKAPRRTPAQPAPPAAPP